MPIHGTHGAVGPGPGQLRVLLPWGREGCGLRGIGWMPHHGATSGPDSLQKEQCGRCQGCHTPAASFFLGCPTSLCSLVALVPPGAQGTIMMLLSQDRTSWFPNCGEQNMGVYSEHTNLSVNFSPLFFLCSSSSSSLLYLPLHHPPYLCLLCPGHGSGHKDTTSDLPAELLRGCSSGERGISGTRCHPPGSTEAAEEMTGVPIFPVGYRG